MSSTGALPYELEAGNAATNAGTAPRRAKRVSVVRMLSLDESLYSLLLGIYKMLPTTVEFVSRYAIG